MKKIFGLFLFAFSALLITCCTDYEKLAKAYISSQTLTVDDVLDVNDGEEHFLLHFEGIQSKKYQGRKIAKYDYKTQKVEKISTIKTADAEIDLTKVKEYGCSKGNGLLYLIISRGRDKYLYGIYPQTLMATEVCHGRNVEIIGDIILCVSGNNISFYNWSGEALETRRYKGTIGRNSVIMDLATDGGDLYGYYSVKGGTKKNFRGTIKGVNMEMTVFNNKGKEIETLTLVHDGDAITGNCHDIAKWRNSPVKLTYSL